MKNLIKKVIYATLALTVLSGNCASSVLAIDKSDSQNQTEQPKSVASATDKTYDWAGITLTLTSDGILHIPGGDVSTPYPFYLILGVNDSKLVKKIQIEGKLVLKGKVPFLFSFLSSLTSIEGLSKVDTSDVTDMEGFFAYSESLISLDLSKFNTSKVTNMKSMFSGMSKLTSLNLSGFNTSNVTDMSDMFTGSSELTSLDVSKFNTSKVTDMSFMFYRCSGLTSLDVSRFDTSKVTDMTHMFADCSGLTSLDVSKFNTSNVTSMTYMFNGMNVSSIDAHSFDTSKVTTMFGMFSDNWSLERLDLSSFDTSNVINSGNMMIGTNLKSLTLGKKFKFYGGELPYKVSDKKWQNVGTGTESNPNGKNIWTSYGFEKNYNGTVDADTYVLISPKKVGGDITIKYVDQEGNKIAKDTILTGNIGDTFTTPEPPVIKGYTYKKLVQTPVTKAKFAATVKPAMTGTFTADPQSISFVYEKNPVVPVGPVKPNKPNVVVNTTHKTTKKLPQTSEMNTTLLTVSGIVLLGTLTSAYTLKRKMTN